MILLIQNALCAVNFFMPPIHYMVNILNPLADFNRRHRYGVQFNMALHVVICFVNYFWGDLGEVFEFVT